MTAAYARRSQARHIHVMAGIAEDRAAGRDAMLDNLLAHLD